MSKKTSEKTYVEVPVCIEEKKEVTVTGVVKDTVKVGVGVVIGVAILNKIFGGGKR